MKVIQILIAAALVVLTPDIKMPTCPDCGQANCIYMQINNTVQGDGTDEDIEDAVYKVVKMHNITDSVMIKNILANYYL